MNEKQLEYMTEKYRERLEEKHEEDVEIKLDYWIGDQDEEPTPEAIEAKRDQLEEELTDWIDEEVETYQTMLAEED